MINSVAHIPEKIFFECLAISDTRSGGPPEGDGLIVRTDHLKLNIIGVCNFLIHHLEDLFTTAEIAPMVNQVECHPYLVLQELQDFCKSRKIVYEAWSPLMQGAIVDVPLLKELSKKYNKTPAQIALRWNLQKDIITIPKSIKKERIQENADIFDFELSSEDMKLIDQLDRNKHFGAHPDTFNF